MARLTQLGDDELHALLSRWDLTPDRAEPLKGGLANTSFLIAAKNRRWVLTICDEKSADEMLAPVAMLLALERANFPAPRLVRTLSGERVVQFRDCPTILKGFLEGETPGKLNAAQLEQLGAAMVSLHSVPPVAELPTFYPCGFEAFSEIWNAPKHSEFGAWLKARWEQCREAVTADRPSVPIHGDLFPDNLLFSGDRLAAVLDFEEACLQPAIFDLAMAIVGCCRTDNGQLDREAAIALSRSYRRAAGGDGPILDDLLQFAIYAAISIAFWRYRQYHLRHPNPSRQRAHMPMVQLADQLASLGADEFQRGA